jgi:hypothetical protein
MSVILSKNAGAERIDQGSTSAYGLLAMLKLYPSAEMRRMTIDPAFMQVIEDGISG